MQRGEDSAPARTHVRSVRTERRTNAPHPSPSAPVSCPVCAVWKLTRTCASPLLLLLKARQPERAPPFLPVCEGEPSARPCRPCPPVQAHGARAEQLTTRCVEYPSPVCALPAVRRTFPCKPQAHDSHNLPDPANKLCATRLCAPGLPQLERMRAPIQHVSN